MLRSRASAQQSTPLAGDARAYAAAELGATRLAGSWVPLGGGALTFRLTPRIDIGGAARIGLTRPPVAREGSRVDLHFGYAGVTIGLSPAPAHWPGLRLGALLGAGNAEASDPEVGALLDSDNGLVAEPSARYALRLAGRVSAAGTVSWRLARGFRVLGGVRSRDLRGPAASVGVTLGPF